MSQLGGHREGTGVTDVLSESRRVELRRCPEIRWSDAAGNHAHALRGRSVVGSGAGVDIRVADPAVSRLHAEFDLRDDATWVRDLDSRNGTFVGDVRVGSARVSSDHPVRVGTTLLTIHDATRPTAVDLWPEPAFGPLVGRSVVMRELFAVLARVAPTDATVLIQGETGTGKELVAQAIHDASARADKPLVVVDCAALPEALIEAELFGHTRGAFTGARDARAGAIEDADHGTVFLDEVGELPLAMQRRLLRVLEAREVRRVGETAHRAVDVRFLVATHRDLRSMVNSGAFREDLYFRLAVVPITVPPLRARLGDVPLLVERFVPPAARARVTPGVLAEFAAQRWVGNVRELRNAVERLLILGPDQVHEQGPPRDEPAALPAVTADTPFKQIRDRWIEHLEREYLQQLLARHDRNVNAIAAAAGLDRAYIYRLIKKHRL